MNVQGIIKLINETQQISDKFKKREFVLEFSDNPQYPQFVKFEVIQDAVGLLDSFQVGTQVEVEFNLRGREWINPQGQAQYFNTLQAWKITPASSAMAASPEASVAGGEPQAPTWGDSSDDDDALPF